MHFPITVRSHKILQNKFVRSKALAGHGNTCLNSSIWEVEAGDLCEFKLSLVYIVISRTATVSNIWLFVCLLVCINKDFISSFALISLTA